MLESLEQKVSSINKYRKYVVSKCRGGKFSQYEQSAYAVSTWNHYAKSVNKVSTYI